MMSLKHAYFNAIPNACLWMREWMFLQMKIFTLASLFNKLIQSIQSASLGITEHRL